ncbi:peptidase U32 family protein [Methanogenium cariaci]|uniref:peptidase U32 family protein n=1 Tax=Methanogenium cariaci TaxID=2197 RepID=UPI000784E1BA|nr:U32 family peptidase [Methanogenium cariaci]
MAQAAALCHEAGADLIWKWPRITRQEFLDKACRIPVQGISGGVMGENISALAAARRAFPDLPPLRGGSGLNIFNSQAARIFGRDCVSVTLSPPELSFDAIGTLVFRLTAGVETDPIPECIIHGPAELAVSEDCIIATAHGRCLQCGGDTPGDRPWFGIQDVKKHIFPVTVDAECRTHVWNSRETCIIDHLDLLVNAGIRHVAIDCRIRNGRYAESVVRAYQDAFALLIAGGESMKGGRKIQALKDRVHQRASGGGLPPVTS